MQRLLTKREKIIFYCTIGAIIFSVCYNFLIEPILTKNELLNKEISFTTVKLKKYLWLLKQKDNIQTKYNKFAVQLKGVSSGANSLVRALSDLEDLAKNTNIQIIDMRPQAISKNQPSAKEIIIDLKTEGTMENYLKFIYNLENSLSLLEIRKFYLNIKPNSLSLEGSFTISQVLP